jgi:LacI family transcriptional regulator
MHQPFEAIAARAVAELIELIQGRPLAPARIGFATELVVRDSTGPAPTA